MNDELPPSSATRQSMVASVLVIDARPRHPERLVRSLTEAGFRVAGILSGTEMVLPAVQEHRPDAILIDIDSPSRDALEGLVGVEAQCLRPIVMLTAMADSGLAQEAARHGISAYVVDGFSPELLRSLIEVSSAHFEHHRKLSQQLRASRQSLETLRSRRLVDQAKLRLVETLRISERDAHRRMQRLAMNYGMKMPRVARLVIDGDSGMIALVGQADLEPSPAPPEKRRLRIGFVGLSDCASLVMAHELGLFRKYGLEVALSPQPSWAALRERLLGGELDAAHMLYGMVYGMHLGIGSLRTPMALLMGLNHNGQSIVLSRRLFEQGVVDGPSLRRLVERQPQVLTMAQTFPTGTHAMWLNYWLAASGIDPLRQVRICTVPPAQMIAGLRSGALDGCCVGDPWGALAVDDGCAFVATTSQAIWPQHPEKVLGCTGEFANGKPNTAAAMIRALLQASRYADTTAFRDQMAAVLVGGGYLDAPERLIAQRLHGEYADGLGRRWRDAEGMKFHNNGEVNYPRPSHGMWFLTQMQRWRLLTEPVDLDRVARQVSRTECYEAVARSIGVSLPQNPMQPERLCDDIVWDPARPDRYLEQFSIGH